MGMIMEKKINNPIVSGFYPDPSVCRVDDDYYMVCSSFELYPGLPLFHSRDLANWHCIGHALTLDNGFHVHGNVLAGGVMAPTIRYHEGTFYIINANFGDKGNFIISAKDPKGPWSQPVWLEEIKDIDASLFFDIDGKSYIVYPSNVKGQENKGLFHKERGIFLVEFDLKTMRTVGEAVQIWDSALRDASAPEAPHLYHIDAYYYLVIAEGGTEHYHAVTVARSKSLFAWYEGNPANPVMTHRHMGFDCPVANVGHADLVDTSKGEWYAVMLASRQIEGQYKNLGRETFICPVKWERDWPVFSPETGKVENSYPLPQGVQWMSWDVKAEKDDFDEPVPDEHWCFWGTPYQDFWRIEDSRLYLKCLPRPVDRPITPVIIGKPNYSQNDCLSILFRRQTDVDFEASCSMVFKPVGHASAGLIIMQATNHQIRVEKRTVNGVDRMSLILVTTEMNGPPHVPGFESKTVIEELFGVDYEQEECVIRLTVTGQEYKFYLGKDEENLSFFASTSGTLINPEIVGGMVGTMIGVYATGNGNEYDIEASFDWFSYRPTGKGDDHV